MAIVSVKQARAGRRGDSGSDYNRSYEVVWTVIVDDRYDGPATVGSAPGLPARFAQYVGYENTDDPDALCTSLKPEQDGDDWRKWRVTATFETQFTNQDNQPQENPLDDPVLRWIEVAFEKRKVTKEWNGTDIRNTVGQLIDGIEGEFPVGVYCFERNEATLSPLFRTHNGSTNSGNFYDLLPHEGLLQITAGKPEFRNGVMFYKHTYRVRVNTNKWTVTPANKATGIKDSTSGKIVTVDQFGDPYGEIFLDANSEIIEPGSATPIYYLPAKQIYPSANWAELGLGG